MAYFIGSWFSYSLTVFEWKAYVQKHIPVARLDEIPGWDTSYPVLPPNEKQVVSSGFSPRQCRGKSSPCSEIYSTWGESAARWRPSSLPWLSPRSSSSPRLVFALPASKIVLHSHFFYLNLFIVGLRVSEEVPVKLAVKWSGPENLIS